MVVLDVSDVVVCVENTSQGGLALNAIKNDYLLPALEHIHGGPPSDLDFSSLQRNSSFSLVNFKASDCLPAPSARTQGPFTSTKHLFDAIERLEFKGGRGETHSSGQEALACALKVLKYVRTCRDEGFKTTKHIIYIANSPIYDMPVMQCTAYVNKSIDYLCQEIKEQGIQLSVFAPRKIPFLFRLFEKAGGDAKEAKEKNYAQDLRHMVLVRGLNLEERPVTSKPPPSESPNLKGYPFNSAMSQQQQSMQNQQFINQQQQGGGNHMGGLQNQTILQSALSQQHPQQPPAQQPQENNTTLKGLLGKKPNPINQQNNWNFQVRGQMPGSSMTNQMQQQNMNPRFPQQQQQLNSQQQQQQPMNSMQGMPPGGGGMQGSNMPNMGGPGPATMMPGQMPGGTGPMGVGTGPMGVTGPMGAGTAGPIGSGAGSMIGPGAMASGAGSMGVGAGPMGPAGPMGGPIMGGPGGMGPRPPHQNKIIWSGELEWQEKVKDGCSDQKISHSVACTVSTSKDNGQAEVRPENWPSKLIMQLIPKTLVQTIGGQYFRHSKSVLFHPTECESLEALTKVMGSGFAGCVHFTGTCDIKVLILLYSSEKKAYLGFIPNDQASFVDRIRTVIQQQKAGQIRQGMQQQQMMNQQPNTMNMQQQIPQQGMQVMNSGAMMNQGPPMPTAAGGMMGGNQGQMVMLSGGGENMVRVIQQQQLQQHGQQQQLQQGQYNVCVFYQIALIRDLYT